MAEPAENQGSRTIDIAKSASIDMMALNNKIVNMRQVVRQTKVQVINKLCKNISALKKKKGTDEQRSQNLRKAERFIEEIDSIKHLKDDKVSKYALANTTSFKDVAKVSLSAGPRAMARLADHPIMQRVVRDFREQHSDWRDLAAYLLVKQTGRRFKTKKQKQSKKMSRCVENINASETMTKAYIQERFGNDGLEKAEKRFERKRKRAPPSKAEDKEDETTDSPNKKARIGEYELPSVMKKEDGECDDEDKSSEDSDEELTEDTAKNTLSEDKDGKGIINKDLEKASMPTKPESHKNKSLRGDNTVNTKISTTGNNKEDDSSDNLESSEEEEDDLLRGGQDSSENKSKIKAARESAYANEPSDKDKNTNDNSDRDGETESESDAGSPEVPLKIKVASKNECVIKELDMSKAGDNSLDEDSSAESDSEEEEEKGVARSGSDVSERGSSTQSNGQKKKIKARVPSFLTNKPKKPVSDPFFAGSDDEGDDDDDFNDFDEAMRQEPIGKDDDDGSGYSHKQSSMFYNPHQDWGHRGGNRDHGQGFGWDQRSGSKWQRQERGRGRGRPWSGATGNRGRSWRGTSERTRGGRGSDRSFNSSKPRFESAEKSKSGHFSGETKVSYKSEPISSEKLHPSWEASKKRKAESGIQAFKGSKITFDDDD